MKMVDLSHMMNLHTPGWVGYAGNKMYYAQNLQTKAIVAQRIDTALHVGTHLDGAMHATDAKGDMASYALDYLADIWTIAEPFGPLSPFHYYDPGVILSQGRLPASDALVLALVAACSAALAHLVFTRRELAR